MITRSVLTVYFLMKKGSDQSMFPVFSYAEG